LEKIEMKAKPKKGIPRGSLLLRQGDCFPTAKLRSVGRGGGNQPSPRHQETNIKQLKMGKEEGTESQAKNKDPGGGGIFPRKWTRIQGDERSWLVQKSEANKAKKEEGHATWKGAVERGHALTM